MTGVWESLIPETTSTEPLALPSPDDSLPNEREVCLLPQNSSNNLLSGAPYHRPKGNNCENNNLSSPITISQESDLLHNNSQGSTSRKSPPFGGLPASLNSPEQFWKFYSVGFERRKKVVETENQKRFFLKTGVYNTRQVNVFERTQRYIRDIFTTLVDSKWRWTLLVFSLSYVLSWLAFAVIWFIILTSHGDLDNSEDVVEPCVVGVKTFASIFLFSLETQHTIGYGTRYMSANCPDAIFLLIVQSVAGILIEAFMVGVVFAKLSRPKKRSQTLIFSKNAVVSQRDGQMYLMVRVGDMRNRSSVFEAHVRAQVITKRVTTEGEVIPNHQEEIKMGGYSEDEDRILLFWPTILVHRIDKESPFYSMSATDLMKTRLELVVVLEGVVESTGMTTQLRTSYLPEEILWGRRFRELSSYKAESGQHLFNFDLFNATFPVETPLSSPHDIDHLNLLKLNSLQETAITINDNESNDSVDDSIPKTKEHGMNKENLRQKRTNIQLTIINGMGEGRQLSIDSSGDEENYGKRHSEWSDEPDSSDSDDGRRMCRLSLPGMGKKRQRSSTCTCSTNASDSNV